MECTKCFVKKEIALFPKGRRICFECTKKRKQLWYSKNAEKQKKRSREYKRSHREETKESRRKWYKEKKKTDPEYLRERNRKNWAKHRFAYQETMRKYRAENRVRLNLKHKKYMEKFVPKIKKEVLSAYSNGDPQCNCCGEKDLRFLSLDHIKGDGAKERKKYGGGFNFYYSLKKRGFPQNGYQVLCYNCNFAKRTYEVCPHKLSIV